MPTADRIREIEDEIDEILGKQLQADVQYREDLDAARKAGRGQAFRETSKKYLANRNGWGRRLQDLEDEISR